jgi:hypothetical protein
MITLVNYLLLHPLRIGGHQINGIDLEVPKNLILPNNLISEFLNSYLYIGLGSNIIPVDLIPVLKIGMKIVPSYVSSFLYFVLFFELSLYQHKGMRNSEAELTFVQINVQL